jgi:hypothetical protein
MMRMWSRWTVVVCMLVGAVPAQAFDEPVPASVRAGVRCYEVLNYTCAISKLKKAASALEAGQLELTPAQSLLLHEHLAFSLASIEDHVGAQGAFARCFSIQADYTLDRSVISPKIYGDYAIAKRQVLQARLHRTLRVGPMPSLKEPSLAERDVFVVHVPSTNSRTDSLHSTHVELGTMILFGADAEVYLPGFGVVMEYSYALMDGLNVQAVTQFFQHAYAKDDLKEGHPGTLYILNVGAGVGSSLPLSERVSFGFGLRVGLSMVGVGRITDSTGAFVGLPLSVDVAVLEGFSLGLSVMPMLTVGQDQDGNSAQSLGLPILARFQLTF